MSIINNTLLLADEGGGVPVGAIERSLRFRSSASAYLNRTPASAGSRTTWTYSAWVKRGALGSAQSLLSANSGNPPFANFYISSGNQLGYDFDDGTRYDGVTTAVFRDPSAWYHVVMVLNTTNATANNRFIVYVNGVQQSVGTITFPQNTTPIVNGAAVHNIGRRSVGSDNYFDGYLTEVNFVDGQALTPSSFGEYNEDTGVWQPKKYAGTYGTNGFYLNFSNNASTSALGTDYSGNGNTWTTNNFSLTAGATYDSMIDVPTPYDDGGNGRGNYCVLNALLKFYGGGSSITQGNLNFVSNTSGVTESAFATVPMPSGKWYAEVLISATATGQWIGVSSNITSAGFAGGFSGVRNPGYAYRVSSGNKCNNDNTGVAYGSSSTVNDIIGIAMDADAGSIEFFKNGVSMGVAFTGMTNAGGGWLFGVDSDPSGTLTFNFGQRPFAYTPPTGFKALNTGNLPESTVVDGGEYFNAVLYTGNDTDNRFISSGFDTDLVWIKGRSDSTSNLLFDKLRGNGKYLISNATVEENGFGALGYTNTGPATGGFVVDAGENPSLNGSGRTYVAWNWKANGAGVSNTAGSITSTVSANPTAGFSVVTYTGNGSTGQVDSVGHGLGVTPKLYFIKQRNDTNSWYAFTTAIDGGWDFGLLNTDQAFASTGQFADSTKLYLSGSSTNASGGTYVAYCFAPVAGYSAFGSYTGNGNSTDGPFVYLGFRPLYLMVKRTDSTGNWFILDGVREPNNYVSRQLVADDSGAESGPDAYNTDFTANGFKLRNSVAGFNASGGTFVYMAFAENPFRNALAR